MNSQPRRYAEDTTVTEAKSRAELEALLRRHGAINVLTASVDQPAAALVQFQLSGRLVRFARPYPDERTWAVARRDRERRRIWRVLILWAKARLETIADGDSTVETEFLPWVALPSGQTVADWLRPQIDEVYASGQAPVGLLGPATR